ncbi:hypothetical protein [Candidatus Nephthysia bennettiae]|uniref:Uncharacterized protein n=1 Tax=Candidatus Nephthysia bennettiae TaxID=3127016 RepID=A0A934JYL8_9BACT|nr:hypothetical protein [Candidatus Dormibacteraeota bacterium]
MRKRWLAVMGAAVLVASLAGGTAVASDRLFSSRKAPPPALKGVSGETLAQMGIALSTAQPPPYCGLVSAAVEHGVQPPGRTGCPVSRSAAESAFRQAFPGWSRSGLGVSSLAPASSPAGTVQDAALVRASAPRQPLIGGDRLVWLFVVQGAFPIYRMRPLIACPAPLGGAIPGSGCRGMLRSLMELVFVDGETTQYLTALPVTVSAGGASIQGTSSASAQTLPFTRLP